MTYNIAFISLDGDSRFIALTKRILEKISLSSDSKFVFCDYSLKDLSGISDLKSAHAIMIDERIDQSAICKIACKLGLHTQVRRICDNLIVNDAFCGIYPDESGFRSNPAFGREAYDTQRYSELEIERVARIAYELADVDGASDPLKLQNPNALRRAINLIDMADKYTTSKLWRKIVTDINEDYPQIHVRTFTVPEGINLISRESEFENFKNDVYLAPYMLADIISAVISNARQPKISAVPTAFLGDTALGVFGVSNTENPTITDIMQTIALMLKLSLNMSKLCDKILQKLNAAECECENCEDLKDIFGRL